MHASRQLHCAPKGQRAVLWLESRSVCCLSRYQPIERMSKMCCRCGCHTMEPRSGSLSVAQEPAAAGAPYSIPRLNFRRPSIESRLQSIQRYVDYVLQEYSCIRYQISLSRLCPKSALTKERVPRRSIVLDAQLLQTESLTRPVMTRLTRSLPLDTERNFAFLLFVCVDLSNI